MSIRYSWDAFKGRYGSFQLQIDRVGVQVILHKIPWEHMPYLSASLVMIHE